MIWITIALSVLNIVASGVAAVIAYKAFAASKKAHKEVCEINKRYSSGNVQVVEKALSRAKLERAAMILSEMLRSGCGVNEAYQNLYDNNREDYVILSEVFDGLERVCVLIQDDALPLKVKETEHNKIVNFLGRAQVYCFVDAYKKFYPTLSGFAKELESNRK